MNIVDSSGWLEYFVNGPNAQRFLPALKDVASLIVPVVSIYEVFKVVLRESGENAAMQVATAMQRGIVVEMTSRLAMTAAKTSLELSLPMADSIIIATARLHNAIIWTQDAHFKNLGGVKYFAKK